MSLKRKKKLPVISFNNLRIKSLTLLDENFGQNPARTERDFLIWSWGNFFPNFFIAGLYSKFHKAYNDLFIIIWWMVNMFSLSILLNDQLLILFHISHFGYSNLPLKVVQKLIYFCGTLSFYRIHLSGTFPSVFLPRKTLNLHANFRNKSLFNKNVNRY